MLLLTSGFSTLASIFKLVFLLIVFVALLFAASWFTKWYAGSAMVRQRHRNISVIENYPFGQGKAIYIVKIGNKYIAVAVAKDTFTVLAELAEEELDLHPIEPMNQGNFGDVFAELIKRQKKQDKK